MNEKVFQFCPKCGAKKFVPAEGKNFRCTACQFEYYFNPSGAVAGIVKNPAGQILLTRRSKDPAKGMLDLPGGFIDYHETAEEALMRELHEELEMEVDSMAYFCSLPNVYLYREVEYQTIDIFYVCTASNLSHLKARDEILSFQFYSLDQIDIRQVGLMSIKCGLELLREKVRSKNYQL